MTFFTFFYAPGSGFRIRIQMDPWIRIQSGSWSETLYRLMTIGICLSATLVLPNLGSLYRLRQMIIVGKVCFLKNNLCREKYNLKKPIFSTKNYIKNSNNSQVHHWYRERNCWWIDGDGMREWEKRAYAKMGIQDDRKRYFSIITRHLSPRCLLRVYSVRYC